MKNTIFTDGSSRGNPGSGGWGAIIVDGGSSNVIEIGGGENDTTNNRMELTASIEALKKTDKDSKNVLYTDSSYLINGITKWIKGWKKNGWRTRADEDVQNKDLWMVLSELVDERDVDFKYIRGHVGFSGNERCDEIATSFADKAKINLYCGPLSNYQIKDVTNISGNFEMKADDKKRSKIKAYSYVSSIGGVVKIHHTWKDCEERVKGVAGAKYRKTTDSEDEKKLVADFSKF